MSILADRPDLLQAFANARVQLYSYLGGGGLIIVAALLCPKDLGSDMLRLTLTILFFLGVITLLWTAAEPLTIFLRARLELCLEDFGRETRMVGHVAISLLDRYLSRLVWIAVTIFGLLFLRVLAAWPVGAPLEPVVPFLRWGFWIALLALPMQLVFSTNRLTAAMTLWRIFERQVGQSGFRALTIPEAEARQAKFAGAPVLVTRPYQFEAGGVEWSWREDFSKSTIVFGQSGSGKTVTILNALLDGLLSSADGKADTQAASALILDPKGDFLKSAKLRTLCARTGRLGDLCILNPDQPASSVRWNPFDSTDDTAEISARFAGALELLGMKNTQDTFFIDQAKLAMRHSIALLRATEPPGSPPCFAGVNDLTTKPAALEARLFILYAKALRLAVGREDVPVEAMASLQAPDYEECLGALLKALPEGRADTAAIERYFMRYTSLKPSTVAAIEAEIFALAPSLATAPAIRLLPGTEALLAAEHFVFDWIPMPEKTRGGVQAQLTLMVSPFLGEPFRTIFSGRSTLRLGDVLDQGKLFYVFMPVSGGRSEMSVVVNTLIKLEFYREVLARPRKSRPSLFFCDEFQSFFTADERRGDTAFFAQSRESFHANVIATQNLAGLLMNAPKEEAVDSLLGNCAIKIFLRNTEGKTNQYASEHVFGQYMGSVVSFGTGVGERGGRDGFKESANFTESTQTMHYVPPERFIHLAVPSERDGIDYAEALISLGSRGKVMIERLRFKVHPLDA